MTIQTILSTSVRVTCTIMARVRVRVETILGIVVEKAPQAA